MAEKLLLDTQCRKARAHNKVYRLRDGGGLFLQVLPDGRKYWQVRYTYDGRERLLQIGPYPAITLEAARKALVIHRAVLRQGKDPVVARKIDKLQQVRTTNESFGTIAYEWLENEKDGWSAVHYERNEGLIRRLLMPKLGPLPITEVDVTALWSVLRSAERAGILMSARRARTIASQVFTYAIMTGRAKENPARDLGKAIKKPVTTHYGALKFNEVGPMLVRLQESSIQPVTQAALKLMLYTGLRDFSLRAGRWGEIDYDSAVWTVPADRMKGTKNTRREHSVPLPRQALQILEELAALTYDGPDSFIFPGPGKAGCLAENTIRIALHRLGFDAATAHGMRSLITDALYEAGFRSEAIERQLSHADRNEVRAAYLRSDFMDHRREMMQWWANVCDALRAGKPTPKPRARDLGPILRSEV